MYGDELLGEWIEEDKVNQVAARKRLEEEAEMLSNKMKEKGLVYITYPKFVNLTKYLNKILEHDDRAMWTAFSEHRIKPVATRSLAAEVPLNEYILKAKEERPDCIHYLEMYWLECEMGYAPSTVKAKMAKIRKHQKVGHILLAERKIRREKEERAREKNRECAISIMKKLSLIKGVHNESTV